MASTSYKPGFIRASARSSSDSMPRLPSKLTDSFELLAEISRGGMGRVLKAWDRGLGRMVAVKELLVENMTPADFERFRREALTIAQIRHPNVLRVWDFGVDGRRPYLVMELLEGRSLKELIEDAERQGERPDWEQAAALFAPVADALAACHARGVLHRDLKPANIVVEDATGRPVLIDFGLAKRDPESCEVSGFTLALTRTGEMLGTPAFMAPEQYNPNGAFGSIGEATDVWGLGATLFQTLTGTPPYAEARGPLEIVRAMVASDPPRVRSLNPAAPLWLDDLVAAALRRKTHERPSMAELCASFREGLARGEDDELPPGPGAPGRRRWGFAALALMVIAVAIGLWQGFGPPAEARAARRVDQVLAQLKSLAPLEGQLLPATAMERGARLARAGAALERAREDAQGYQLLARLRALDRWDDRRRALRSLELAIDPARSVGEQSQALSKALGALRGRKRDGRDRRLEALVAAWLVSLRDPEAYDGSSSELVIAGEGLLNAVSRERGEARASLRLAVARVRAIQGRQSETEEERFVYLRQALELINLAREESGRIAALAEAQELAIILAERSSDILIRFLGEESRGAGVDAPWRLGDEARLRFTAVIERDIAAGRVERASDTFALLAGRFGPPKRLGPYERALLGALARWLVKVSDSTVYDERVKQARRGRFERVKEEHRALTMARSAVAREFSDRILAAVRQTNALIALHKELEGEEAFLDELRDCRREIINLMAFLHIKPAHRRLQTLEILESIACWFPEDPQVWSVYYAAMEDYAFFLIQPRAERRWLFRFFMARPLVEQHWRFFRANIARAWSVISLAKALERDRRSLFIEQVQNGLIRAGFGDQLDALVPERYLESLASSSELPRHMIALWVARARVHVGRRELRAAIDDFKRAIDVDEATALSERVPVELAHCYLKLGYEELAREQLLRAIDRRLPDNVLFARGYWRYFINVAFSGLPSAARRRRLQAIDERLVAFVEEKNNPRLAPILSFFRGRRALIEGDRSRAALLFLEVSEALQSRSAAHLRDIVRNIQAGLSVELVSAQLAGVDLNHPDASPF